MTQSLELTEQVWPIRKLTPLGAAEEPVGLLVDNIQFILSRLLAENVGVNRRQNRLVNRSSLTRLGKHLGPERGVLRARRLNFRRAHFGEFGTHDIGAVSRA